MKSGIFPVESKPEISGRIEEDAEHYQLSIISGTIGITIKHSPGKAGL